MEEDDIVVSLRIILIASAALRIRRGRRRPRAWARSWVRRRAHYGAHHSLVRELAAEYQRSFSFDDFGAISLGRPEIFEKVAKTGVGVHIWL